ncbi:hypothetical protein K0038_03497 [Pseudomonas syringae]|nr:hypothetical protein [Pseudomonas syringae]
MKLMPTWSIGTRVRENPFDVHEKRGQKNARHLAWH